MNNDLYAEANLVMRQADCLHDRTAVEAAIDRMAENIRQDLGECSDVVVLCVMNGGLVMTAALLARLDFALRVDYMHATRYRERTSGDDLHWKVEPSQDLAGKHVLVVDDILDEGYTLDAILAFCRQQSPASLRAAVLVQKMHERGVNPLVDYIGLEVPDRYVFGYGMDYKGFWRNAPGIYAVAEQGE
jgi:hypoxanthine phosphoribosyltransferase